MPDPSDRMRTVAEFTRGLEVWLEGKSEFRRKWWLLQEPDKTSKLEIPEGIEEALGDAQGVRAVIRNARVRRGLDNDKLIVDCEWALETLKEEIENLRTEQAEAERKGDLNLAAEIKFGRIPEAEKKLGEATALQAEGERLLPEEVTDELIATIVSRWTGVPADRTVMRSAVDAELARRRA